MTCFVYYFSGRLCADKYGRKAEDFAQVVRDADDHYDHRDLSMECSSCNAPAVVVLVMHLSSLCLLDVSNILQRRRAFVV